LRRRGKASKLEAVRANLASEIRAAVAAAPCSLRALARAADVSHTVLVQIRRGTFLATPTIATKLADALEQWGSACQRTAKRLRSAARRVPTSRTGRKS
jgi:ribosome-binding protein aMBF1 (putative translation factor)